MKPEYRAKLREFGLKPQPEMIVDTMAWLGPMIPPLGPEILVARDNRYGPHERNRLDIFRKEGAAGAPVLAFVHGGGFVMGDKAREGSPFYDNLGAAAARAGMIGVTLNFRLAPEHKFPAGEEDLELAVGWLKANVALFGGDPDRIVLMGQSSGAVHVAGYVAHLAAKGNIAGAVMISGKYDPPTSEVDSGHEAYYGDDPALQAKASCVEGLLASEVPMLFAVNEHDPADFKSQAAMLVGAFGAQGRYPEMHFLSGFNHMAPAISIGSEIREIEQMVFGFVRRVTG